MNKWKGVGARVTLQQKPNKHYLSQVIKVNVTKAELCGQHVAPGDDVMKFASVVFLPQTQAPV
jgi:hypothetical protein